MIQTRHQAPQLIQRILDLSPGIRYVALYLDGSLTTRQRSDLSEASSSESDVYEELIVNPTLLTLVHQRGDIDCGGSRFVLIRYGHFYQLVLRVAGGHASICIDPNSDPLALVDVVTGLLATLKDPNRGSGQGGDRGTSDDDY